VTKFFVYPYKQGSASAKALATALGGRVIKLEGSRYRNKPDHVVINWGSSDCPPMYRDHLNPIPSPLNWSSRYCSDKIKFFLACYDADESPRYVPFSCDYVNTIEGWGLCKIVSRTILNGSSGAGIVISEPGEQPPPAQLYTKYIKKKAEYRIHVMKTRQGSYEVFDWQRKVKDPAREVLNWQVRNHHNGFIFIRETEPPSEDAKLQAIRAVSACGLDFGAVDVLVGSADNLAYVLEVNSAPGLSGVTVDHYRDAFVRNFR